MKNSLKGYLLGAVASATYGMNPLFTLPLYADGMNADSVLFFRYLSTVPILALMLKIRGRDFKITRKQLLPLIFFGLLFAYSSLALFESYNYMDAGIASTLLFIYPIIVALIMTFIYKEKIGISTIVCMTMALCGIALLYKGEEGSTLSLIGTILTFSSALTYAIYIVGMNKSSISNMATIKLTMYVLLFGSSLYGARLLYAGHVDFPSQWYMWGNILGMAILPTAVSLVCTTAAIQYVGSTTTAILGALEPVTAIFIGITLFGEDLTLREFCGVMLIIIAVTLVVAGGNITGLLVRIRKMFPRIPRIRIHSK